MSLLDMRLLRTLREAAMHMPASELARQLAAPFATVKARLAGLREAGFEIEEHPGLGVRLLAAPDRLIADDLQSRLGACPLVREILVFEETDSTNNVATRRGRQGAAGGLVVFAEHQTAGRGRFGRRWDSASHRGLWFSLLLRPEIPAPLWTRLTTWAAVSLAAAIEQTVPVRAEIKWPNDVFIAGKKVAGLLAESGIDTRLQPFAVLGLGVNVNHEPGDFSPELHGKAGSLRAAAGQPIDRPVLAAAVLRELDARLPQLHGDFSPIVAEAVRRSTLLGRWIAVRAAETTTEGYAESLDETGHLLLRTHDGTLQKLTAGETTIHPR